MPSSCSRLRKPSWEMSVDHPLGDHIVGQLGQTPGRKRRAYIGRHRERDLRNLAPLRKRELPRPAAAVARIQRLEPVAIEVVDHLTHGVGIGEHHLADRNRAHALGRQEHDLRPPPGHHRPGRAPHQAQKPVALLVADRAQLHSPRQCGLPTQDWSERPLRRQTRGPPRKPANVAGQSTRCRSRARRLRLPPARSSTSRGRGPVHLDAAPGGGVATGLPPSAVDFSDEASRRSHRLIFSRRGPCDARGIRNLLRAVVRWLRGRRARHHVHPAVARRRRKARSVRRGARAAA